MFILQWSNRLPSFACSFSIGEECFAVNFDSLYRFQLVVFSLFLYIFFGSRRLQFSKFFPNSNVFKNYRFGSRRPQFSMIFRNSNVIKKNFIINNNGSGINISGTYIYEGLTIENNIISGNSGYALNLTSNTNSTVRYNSILNSGGSGGNPSVGIPSSYFTSICFIILSNLTQCITSFNFIGDFIMTCWTTIVFRSPCPQ